MNNPYLPRAEWKHKEEPRSITAISIIAMCIIVMMIIIIGFCASVVRAEIVLTASWYSLESCLYEGTSGIMANGKRLNDEKLTCASWDYKFGTLLKVTNLANGKSVIVEVTDRGPAKRLYRKGRILDLSKEAFRAVANFKSGVIPIKVEVVK